MHAVHLRQLLRSIAWMAVAPMSCCYSLALRQAPSKIDGPRHRVVGRDVEIIPGSVGDVDTDRNWSQSGQGSINISQGGIIAIAVIVGIVVILGVTSAVLFYIAKKRSWEIRASIRRSARRLATPLTPRRFSTAPTSSKPRNREEQKKPKEALQQRKSGGREEMLPPFDRDVEKAVDAKSPTGKSEFEPFSPKGWKQMIPFGSAR
ncbi:hypothetical protein I7I53_12013 [Histoplasma capsulatum var. duboisii H88]|uniref:Uncharacterized protein n=3 Tax=Ajellomyces capsulatus TaxID=5037 RepID=A0A8A1LZA4_AJEC8|nr:hypothetical protein I7I53_12013 [Histoplasma capsulatum var. duboisii H88]